MAGERREAVNALTDAQIVMGAEKSGRGRGARTNYRADNDPLAFWLGVESIMQLIEDANLRPLGDGK